MSIVQSYVGNELFSRSDYYIHRHIESIGKASKGARMGDGQLAEIFWNYRNQAYQAVKTQYRSLFKTSIVKEETSQQALDIIEAAMSSDKLMTKISSNMGKALKEALPVSKMRQLMKVYLNLNNIDFNKMEAGLARQRLAQFDKFLQTLYSACLLIKNKQTGIRLGQLLLNVTSGRGNSTRYRVGTNLLAALDQMKREMEGMTLSRLDVSQIEKISFQLETIANFLKSNSNINSLSNYFPNLFSQGFAEAISAQLTNTVILKVKQEINKAKLVGKQDVRIAYYDEKGLFKEMNDDPASGKADVIFPNVQFHMKKNGKVTAQGFSLTISLGVSDKFYKTNKFPGIVQLRKEGQKFSGGGSGQFIRMLKSTIGENIRTLYLAYNTLAYQDSLSLASRALQEVVSIRGLVNFFAARGGQPDFAQYMFINGQVIPIWDVIMATSVFVKNRDTMNAKIYYLTLTNVKQLKKKMAEYKANPSLSDTHEGQINRVHTLNFLINQIGTKSELNLKTLRNLRQLPI